MRFAFPPYMPADGGLAEEDFWARKDFELRMPEQLEGILELPGGYVPLWFGEQDFGAGLQTGFELVKKRGLIRKFVKDIEEQSKVDLCRKVNCVCFGLVQGDNVREIGILNFSP